MLHDRTPRYARFGYLSSRWRTDRSLRSSARAYATELRLASRSSLMVISRIERTLPASLKRLTTRRSGTRGRLSIHCPLTTSYDINWCDSDAPVGGGPTRAHLPVSAPHPKPLFACAISLAVSTDVSRHPDYEGDAPTSHRIRRYREAQVISTLPHRRRSHRPPSLKMQTISLPGTPTGTPFSPPTKQKSSNSLFSWPSVQSNSVLEILSRLVRSSSKTSFVSFPSPQSRPVLPFQSSPVWSSHQPLRKSLVHFSLSLRLQTAALISEVDVSFWPANNARSTA
jgi:hypothetical protein